MMRLTNLRELAVENNADLVISEELLDELRESGVRVDR
ncbi:MAG: hypothetical protein US13_C0017G0006 [candidate division TM6 bacterium GW2011_GWE2_36_25]|nr:MAG: hypothetical protein US03_C0017G0006 [candidate division TM6 bacterium GW2011_GWF2_36_131]KKQ02362.1 MAG: hypothetical protein US13_C0017G0006 [candidate division TM6 bacterium GW2011_GWE2_36_25]